MVCEEIEPNLYAIKAGRALAGTFELRGSATTATRLQFVADSFVHDARPLTNVVDMPEWNDTAELRSRVDEPPQKWDDVPEPLDDLLEAIYAGGRRGWGESDLIPLLERTLPDVINPWDFLRSLQDATVLTPFLRARFRGRTWKLGPVALRCGPAPKIWSWSMVACRLCSSTTSSAPSKRSADAPSDE
jgi:hypothetical protein